jgi:hypothetical protein
MSVILWLPEKNHIILDHKDEGGNFSQTFINTDTTEWTNSSETLSWIMEEINIETIISTTKSKEYYCYSVYLLKYKTFSFDFNIQQHLVA